MNPISTAIQKLRQLTQLDVQNGWYCYAGKSAQPSFSDETASDWHLAEVNENDYICWPAGRQVCWLAQKFVIPHSLQDYPLTGMILRLKLAWWAEDAKIFLNQHLIQEGDLFDSSTRILLTEDTVPGTEIIVTLRLVSPGHDGGGLMQSRLLYELNDDRWSENQKEPGFVADELAILQNYLTQFLPEKLTFLEEAIAQLNWADLPNRQHFDHSLQQLRQTLLPLSDEIKNHSMHLLGHAHLDLAWLWPVAETWEAAQRTFSSVLALQQEDETLTFCHTSPALYDWIENHRPDLFAGIQTAIKRQTWEIVGGMWVEPEVNLTSGESLVRQLLYGQRYCREKFGEVAKVAWLPDSFGFTWQLPQLFKLSEIEYFVTGKLHWNDATEFPYGAFWWRSPDGTELFTVMSPPNVEGVMDTHPITMTNYAVKWQKQTGFQDSLWLPGVGDHGGGPTRDMLAVKARWQQSPFFPQVKFTTALSYLSGLQQQVTETGKVELPTWEDELYLELHRGCYTAHADQKWFNRRCEGWLYEAELWASIATILLGENHQPYPKQEIEQAWKKVLFNQFHDILPGTSIPEVFVDANQAWEEVATVSQEIIETSLGAIASQIPLINPPHPEAKLLVVFNALNWQRSTIISCPDNAVDSVVLDENGNVIPSQITHEQRSVFQAKDIPSIGYRCFWLIPQLRPESEQAKDLPSDPSWILDNGILRVTVNPETGDLDSLFDLQHQREILREPGNQLQAFRDQGQYWDAWNIDPDYEQHRLPETQLKSIEVLESGPLRWRIRVVRLLGQSVFTQDYVLEADSPLLKVESEVDWREEHVLVKANFPLTVSSDFATYEIPFAAIERPTRSAIPAEAAKWEVSALRWADLTNKPQNYGVSLLNDSKYGYDSRGDNLRISLLRSPIWPDPGCDRGLHQFTYAIYPHTGSWDIANTVHLGYELNVGLRVVAVDEQSKVVANGLRSRLKTAVEFINVSEKNLIVTALKQAEDNPESWILRCYEAEGKKAELKMENVLDLEVLGKVNLLENHLDVEENRSQNVIEPWQVKTIILHSQ